MKDNLKMILDLAGELGTVEEFHRYGNGFTHAEGVTPEGRRFTITLFGEEKEENA